MKKRNTGMRALALAAAACALGSATAQQRVEITGSSIKRTDAETALPVQVITRDEIQRSGVVNIEQLMQSVSAMASSGSITGGTAAGSTTGSISAISLRGLTSARTLVLINGRRIAPYGIGFVGDSVSVDINTIPLSAVERVEVLKDGASAVYGSDAVAGVVNFILRRDHGGIELSAEAGRTEAGGGGTTRANLVFGRGRLESDGYNVMLLGSVQKEDRIVGSQRDFARRGYNVAANNDTTSFNTFPANLLLLDATGNVGNAAAPGCPGPYSSNTPFTDGTGTCAFDPSPVLTLLPDVERVGLFGTLRFMIGSKLEGYAEASWSRSKTRTVIQPVPLSASFTLPPNNPLVNQQPYNGNLRDGTPSGLPPSRSSIIVYPDSRYYPTATVQALLASPTDPLPPITVFYRSAITGNRDITDISEAPRLVAGVRGEAAGWEVDGSLLRSSSRMRQQVNGGFPANSLILPILNSGNVNFWGPSDPDVEAAIRATGFTGDAFRISSDLTSLGGKASRELMPMGGGMLSVAVGGEFRREDYLFDPNPTIQTGDISGYGGNFLVTDRSRNVAAAFAEVVAPVAKGLELGAAVRFDRYQGVGHASAPKLSLRWQPVSEVLLRASVGRGFRAPSLQDLYLPQTTNVTPQGATDPIRCPVTDSRNDCGTQFNVINGGNPDLKPERSRNVTLGLVVAPTNRISFSMDYFNIDLKETIVNGITAATILGDLDAYGYLVTRGPTDPAFPNLPGPITAINQTNLNLGRTKVQGLDFEAKAQQALGEWGRVGLSFSGSYFIQFDVQNLDGSYTGGVDVANAAIGGVVPRWKHNLSGDWSHGPWGVTLTQNFHKGYRDLPSTNDAPGAPVRRVGHYETLDAQLRYTGFKGLQLKLGIRNLRDQAPPYSNAGGSTNFQGGYDVSYTDPRGRLFYAGLSVELP